MSEFKIGETVRYTGGLSDGKGGCDKVDRDIILVDDWGQGFWGAHCVKGEFHYLQCDQENFHKKAKETP